MNRTNGIYSDDANEHGRLPELYATLYERVEQLEQAVTLHERLNHIEAQLQPKSDPLPIPDDGPDVYFWSIIGFAVCMVCFSIGRFVGL